jgi:hypothetical protein
MLFSKRLERIADGLSIYWRDRKPLPTKASVVADDQYGALESRSRAIIWLTIFSFGGGWVGLVSN